MAVHVHHRSDTRVLYRVDDSRRSQQTCGGAAAAMIWPDHHQSRRPKELPNIEGLRKLRNKREHEGLGIGNENFCFNVFQWLYSIGSTEELNQECAPGPMGECLLRKGTVQNSASGARAHETLAFLR